MTPAQLRAARAAIGLSQAELAERLGVSHRQLGRWERGQWPVPPAIALAVEALLQRAGLAGLALPDGDGQR